MELSGKTALVTGGRQGIGRAIAERFVKAGAQTIVCGRTPAEMPAPLQWYTCDVSDPAQVDTMARAMGRIDILVNNAGVQIEKTVTDSSDADWEAVIGVNARGTFNCCRAFIPLMTKGVIINIGSISGTVADPAMALYNASKSFVHGLTRSLAVDHGPDIRCNAICPGWIMTDMADAAFAAANNPSAAQADALNRHPAGRFGQPADIAEMALWLASDAAGFATGQLFTVDGGMTAASPLHPALF